MSSMTSSITWVAESSTAFASDSTTTEANEASVASARSGEAVLSPEARSRPVVAKPLESSPS